ncbi:CHAD domain-containing protein [Chamaesiphon sp. VAR_48_metabat_403]|uniref:CHAD domain-containing protein n=1 Tax=Chamaesiphon sp. VAR_48_metabat_403 TaxID=2964700 RepID=UPI00286E43B1|nr:CHAD domain-containing protein [Chamaesiphon sp. VAR_48_metabat_403]
MLFQQERATVPVTLADYIYPAIQKQYVRILTLEADVLADEDCEAVHQIRVSLRRLRSQIQAFGSMMDIPEVMDAKSIGKIARVLGKVRDLDVLHQTCKHHLKNLSESEKTHLEKVDSAIGKRRRKEILKVKLMLNDSEYQFFKLGMNNWLNHPQYLPTARVEIGTILPELLLSVVSKLFLNSGWWIDLELETGGDPELAASQVLLVHGDTLHDLRKQIKATRYLMEMFPDRYPVEYNDYLQDFKQIHQIFGNIQDNRVFDKFIRKSLGKRAPMKLPILYERLARSNHLNWDNWQPIQHKYRDPNTKQKLQALLIQDIIHNLHG